jgi:hypothetical protein
LERCGSIGIDGTASRTEPTRVLGLLDQGLLETEHSLAEAKVLFELAQRDS